MKIYLHNGEAIDDGRVARSTQEHEGWYTGKLIEDRDGPTFPWWLSAAAVVALCIAIILLCTVAAPEKSICDNDCQTMKRMSTTLTLSKEK